MKITPLPLWALCVALLIPLSRLGAEAPSLYFDRDSLRGGQAAYTVPVVRVASEAPTITVAPLGDSPSVTFSVRMPEGAKVRPQPALYVYTLWGISQVETGGGRRIKRGSFGELTHVQIRPETWRRFSRMRMSTAPAAEVERVAYAILEEIANELRRQKQPVTAYNLALGWNAGAWAKRYTSRTLDYAERVHNLAMSRLQPKLPAGTAVAFAVR